jgi:hypothetical protein
MNGKFDNGGIIREDCPVELRHGRFERASPRTRDLDTLYDRFLLRKKVRALSNDGLLTALMMKSPGELSSRATAGSRWNTLDEAQEEIMGLFGSVEVALLIKDLWLYLRESLDVDLTDWEIDPSSPLVAHFRSNLWHIARGTH